MIDPQLKDQLVALSRKRAAHVRSLVENDDHSHRILAEELYGNPAHFLFELLQNAEDEGAAKIFIELDEKSLSFTHNGRAFDAGDIESITTIGHNERKKQKSNSIGRFGIGFKSVFSITKTPEITSGGFRFALRDYIVPEFSFDEVDSGKTTIKLPFVEDAAQSRERFTLLQNAIHDMDHRHILFLKNVKEIRWVIRGDDGTTSGELIRATEQIAGTNLSRIRIVDSDSEQGFVLGERPVSFAHKQLSVKIALMVEVSDGQERFAQVDESFLFAFFPTTVETNLAFLVHAPFVTTPARDNLQEKDEGANTMLLSELVILLGDMVDELGQVERIDTSLWNILPCEKEHTKRFPPYATLYAGFADRARAASSSWWKASTGRFIRPAELQLSTSPAITSLFTKLQSEQLFGRGYWLAQEWTKALDPDVRTFLRNELKVPEVDMAVLKNGLTDEFIQEASDEWMLKLYGCITTARAFEDWKQEPIIRIDDGSHKAAFSKRKRLVFRPVDGGSDYPCVKESIASARHMKEFMDGMDIKKPDVVDEVLELLIPKIRKKDQPYPQLRRHIERILEALDSANEEERKSLLSELTGLAFLPARSDEGVQVLAKADGCYYPSDNLKAYFKDAPDILWLDLDFIGEAATETKFKKLIAAIGVRCQPRKRTVSSHLDRATLVKLTGNGNIQGTNDYDLEHLSQVLTEVQNLEQSLIIWNALLGSGLPGRLLIRDLVQGKVVYGNWNWKQEMAIPSLALQQLRESAWVFDDNGRCSCPSDLTERELNPAYPRSDAESLALVEFLDFKADEASRFEADHPDKKVLDKAEYEELMALKRERDEANARVEARKKKMDVRLLDIERVEGVELDLDNLVPEPVPRVAVVSEPDNGFTPVSYVGRLSPTARTDYTVVIAPEQEDLGQWGEAYVEKILKKRCTTDSGLRLVPLNNEDMSGVGRDFQIHKGEKLVEVIEVKTTSYDATAPVKLSRRQWEQAVKYHRANGDTTYWLYCVFLANTPKPQLVKIKDPVAEVERGRLIVDDLVIRVAQ